MDLGKSKTVRDAFATVLRQKRNEAKLSQEELGFRSGVTMRYISLLETNKRQPTISTLAMLCEGLGISMSDFLGEIEKRL